MASGIPQPPGSMLKPPSQLKGPASRAGAGKRKLGENEQKAATGKTIPAAGRQIKAPVARAAKANPGTVTAGRRSSNGFKVEAKQPGGIRPPGMAKAGGGAAPRQAPGPRGQGRLQPYRTSVTQGRQPVARGAAVAAVAAKAIQSSNPPQGGVKRRRIKSPARPNAGRPVGDGAGKAASNTGSPFPGPSNTNGGLVGGILSDGDDDSSEDDDDGLGPPPEVRSRPEDDYNGRLYDLEMLTKYMYKKNRTARKTKKHLRVELESHSTNVTQLEYDKRILETRVDDAEKRARQIQETADDAQRRLQSEKQRHGDELDEVQRKHRGAVEQMHDEQQKLSQTVAELQGALDSTRKDLQAKKDECSGLETTASKQARDQVELESRCRGLQAKVEQLEDGINEREIRIAELEEDVASRSHTIEDLEAKLRREETLRRGLHNTIQELKGNIRVFCRVRPLQAAEKEAGAALPVSLPSCEERNQIELTQTSENALGRTTSKSFPFKFDRVFGPESTQGAVFDEVSQLIQSALDGYPVCIFAYGQTSSGKTHTMQGPSAISATDMDSLGLGIIPRAVRQIYDNTSKLAERGWEYSLEGQFLEIYNETIQDLLAPTTRGAQGSDKQARLDIYQDSEGHTRVKNVTTVGVDSAERVHWLLARAAENRTVAATNCNERSSRSHSVFTLYLRGKNSLTGESSSGVLNLIDLAGSERLSSSGSSGDRLKETQAINKSLACLGDVIAALAKGNRHIPYRNSKLTHLLQESLGAGNSKTLMFVCVNPSPTSAQESLCSLQFATKVNSCQIGTARRQAS